MTQHRTPTQHKHYTTLIVAVFPLAIYFLQLIGKASTIATCAGGILVVLKVVVELCHHRAPRRQVASRPRLVRVEAPIAGCYLCKDLQQLRLYQISGQRVGICQHCYHCLDVTGRHA